MADMADRSPYPDRGDDTGAGPERTSNSGAPTYPGTPRWVKVSGIVALVLVVLAIILIVAGGGQHGPGRHLPSGAPGDPGGLTPPVALTVELA
jgi:hypothetical protein